MCTCSVDVPHKNARAGRLAIAADLLGPLAEEEELCMPSGKATLSVGDDAVAIPIASHFVIRPHAGSH